MKTVAFPKLLFLTFLLFTAFTKIGFSQNLVPNPGFEQAIRCDTVLGPAEIDTIEQSSRIIHSWFNSQLNQSNIIYVPALYFNNCFSINPQTAFSNIYNNARTGQGCVFLYLYNKWDYNASWTGPEVRAFPQVKLLRELQANCVYQVEFYVRCDSGTIAFPDYGATDGLGAYLSNNRVNNNYLSITPQISNTPGNFLTNTKQYVKISGLYTATGGEQYLTIGNFKSNLASNFQRLSFNDTIREIPATYFLDDVSVIPVTAANYSLNLGPDTVYCDNQPINQTLSAPNGFAAYEWSTGATTASIQVTQPGTYWVNADFGCGFLSDTIRIDTKPSFIEGFELGNDTVICAQGPFRLPLRTKRGFTTYTWNTGDTTQNIFATSPGTYWVKATYDCGTISDTIKIEQFQPGKLFSFTDTVLCVGESVNLMPASGFASYNWASGETSQSLTVSQAGKYKVTATTAAGCSVSDSVMVSFKAPVMSFSIGKDTVLCEKESLKIEIEPQAGIAYLWNDGVKAASRIIDKPGIYKLTASDRCSSFSEEIEVKFRDCTTIFVPNIITPNHDGHNDFLEIATPTNRQLNLKIYNRWGILVYEEQDYRNNWPKEKISSGTYYYLLSDPELNKAYKGWLEVVK